MEFHYKILKFTKRNDPQTWWREYPPKFIYKEKRISAEKVKKHLKMVFDDKSQKIGVYIQIPFCWSKCHFCKFYSEIPKTQKEIDNYLDYLEKELNLYEVNFKNIPIGNLYIGGGTPTLLNKKQWEKLFRIIHKFFVFKKDAQILTEGTPETCTYEKLKLLKDLGINRFTIGAQSFDEKVLKNAGRNHTVKDIYQSFSDVRRTNIPYINLDILLGLVGETWNSYNRILKGVIDLKPDCVSFMTLDLGYPIDTEYEKEAKKSYFFKQSLKSKIFSYLGYVLEKTGYERAQGFSDSTFILKGREKSVNHNLLNRNKLNFVFGLGSEAESSFGSLKYYITADNKEYLSNIKLAKLPCFTGIELSRDEYIRRYFIYSFVLWGKINKKNFQKRFNEKIEKVIDKKFKKLKKDQILFDIGEDFIFLPSSKVIKGISKYSGKNYGKQERSFLFCLKYFYSLKIINQYKNYF